MVVIIEKQNRVLNTKHQYGRVQALISLPPHPPHDMLLHTVVTSLVSTILLLQNYRVYMSSKVNMKTLNWMPLKVISPLLYKPRY